MSSAPGTSGAFAAVKNIAATALAVGQTRLQLLGNELEVARITAMRQLMLAQALLFCVGLAVVLSVACLALAFWEHRVIVVALAAALGWAVALYCFVAMRRTAAKTEPMFATSLAELQEDLHQLRAASGHGRPAD
ncbi:phage holin family protein [Rhodoferax sp.]|uniref:phage holin family protein n=1 Tax=Rhodoferax sp. TaxID=50421 RepID=UPI0027737C88|nr:phage holin family protein [Rhodoferax sp.]